MKSKVELSRAVERYKEAQEKLKADLEKLKNEKQKGVSEETPFLTVTKKPD